GSQGLAPCLYKGPTALSMAKNQLSHRWNQPMILWQKIASPAETSPFFIRPPALISAPESASFSNFADQSNYMKKLIFLFLLTTSLSTIIHAQTTKQVWRINAINPGIEYEQPVSSKSTVSFNIGVGYNGSYPELSNTFGTRILYAFAPFADLQFKRFYNLEKRASHNKTTAHNSGNFISFRFRTHGKSIKDNFYRYADYDFAVGPTWGIQRKYGKFHLLFDLGPQFYFDSEGNSGFWP